MNHDVAVQQKMTERFLLGELDPELRDEFEEHFFDCPDCALDVRAAATFVEHSKTVLGGKPGLVSTPAPAPVRPGWFGWLRPAFTVPAMALLLAVIGYQDLQLRKLHQPQVLPLASLNLGTYAGEEQVISAHPGDGFLLLVRITPDTPGNSYSHYVADLYNPAGKLDVSLTISSVSVQEQVPVFVPGAKRVAGKYKLTVQGVTEDGKSTEVGSKIFELQLQN